MTGVQTCALPILQPHVYHTAGKDRAARHFQLLAEGEGSVGGHRGPVFPVGGGNVGRDIRDTYRL